MYPSMTSDVILHFIKKYKLLLCKNVTMRTDAWSFFVRNRKSHVHNNEKSKKKKVMNYLCFDFINDY